jgi:hypothetical protein
MVRGEKGVTRIIFLVEYDYFCYSGIHAKFQTPTTNLSGRMCNNRRKISKKITKILATSCATAVHALCLDQFLKEAPPPSKPPPLKNLATISRYLNQLNVCELFLLI